MTVQPLQTTTPPNDELRFAFGKNWEQFVKACYSPARLAHAQRCLLEFLKLPNLTGRTFLDIGCGSGLSSLAALESGAERIVSFDLDPASVRTTESLRAMKGNPAHWTVLQGSVLDQAFLATLEPADIVYSWGVLHHTGQMWQAIDNVVPLMRPDGLLFIALYRADADSNFWWRLKRRYNRGGYLTRRFYEGLYVLYNLVRPNLFRPWRMRQIVREYQDMRGMSYMHDVRDWLGGFPFEFAHTEEVLRRMRDHHHLEWVNLHTLHTIVEYSFRRGDSPGSSKESIDKGR